MNISDHGHTHCTVDLVFDQALQPFGWKEALYTYNTRLRRWQELWVHPDDSHAVDRWEGEGGQ